MIEHTFVAVEEGVHRLTFPLPTGPRHVHCYVIDGTLFDTGLGLVETDWSSLGFERIAITHMHPDHVGGSEAAARQTGAPVFQGGLDYAQSERVWGSTDWPERMAAWFQRNGVPEPIAEELIEQGHAFAAFLRFVHDPALLYEGSELEDWSVIELPGHADGHLGFLRDGVLVGGDHLLARITPAVGLYPDSRPNPLADYLASLERTIELAPRLVLPGHGEPIEDAAGRAREIVAHHHERLEQTQAALSDRPQTGFELSHTLFGPRLSPTQRRFAVAETLSHLELLRHQGSARRDESGGVLSYSVA